MTDKAKPIYRIEVTTTTGEKYIGLMTKKMPDLVNGFLGIALEDGSWVYLKPELVELMKSTLVVTE